MKTGKTYKRAKNLFIWSLLAVAVLVAAFALVFVKGSDFLGFSFNPQKPVNTPLSDKLFGWKFPVAKFPTAGETQQIAYSNIRDPGGVSQGLPVRLKIPAIGVNSAIEDALITSDGRMDVPAGTVNVAWFARGPHPGKEGSAVIAGHFGIDQGVPKVFYNLDKLKAGNKIYVEDDSGKTLAFIVRRTQSFDRNADATTVFTSSDGIAHLNLITCEGIWNQVNDTYPTRLVIFTDSIPGEGAIAVKAMLPEAAIKIPKPTPISAPSETPGPTPPPVGVLTDTTSAPGDIKDRLAQPRILIASIKSLYTTPMDGVITSFLLISIVFLLFKILRR